MGEKMVIERIMLTKELERRVEKWKEDERISFEVFKKDLDKQNSICYNMLIAIQTAIDLGNSIIEERKLGAASTYSEVFEILAKNRILPRGLAKKLSSLARFRNVLAHLYWKVDYKEGLQSLETRKEDYGKFFEGDKGV